MFVYYEQGINGIIFHRVKIKSNDKTAIIIRMFISNILCKQCSGFSGTWRGEMTSDMSRPRRTFIFYIHLGQEGRSVWGVYSSGRIPKIDSVDCVCRVEGQLDKRNGVVIKLYKDKVINNRISYQGCDFIRYLEFEYNKEVNEEILRGKWYGILSNNSRPDYAGGSMILRKITPKTIINVEQYFPDLPLIIKKNNSGDSLFTEPKD